MDDGTGEITSENHILTSSIIGAVRVGHDYRMILAIKSDQNHDENQSLIMSESPTLTVPNVTNVDINNRL